MTEPIVKIAGFTLGMFLGLLAVVYLWMAVLVSWLGYDYVTSSSIFFLLSVVGVTIPSLIRLIRNPARNVAAALVFIGLYPLLFAGALRVYEAWSRPDFSEAVNVVAFYRGMVSAPLNLLTDSISALGPAAASAVTIIEASPLLTQVTGAVIVSLATWLVTTLARR